MVGAMLVLLGTFGAAQEPIDFQLGWKKGDRLEYVVGVVSPFGNGEGRMVITVDSADEKGFTVSWPQITFSGSMKPHAAGSCWISKRGRLNVKATMPDACSFLFLMMLPEKPVAVGAPLKVAWITPGGNLDMNGKVEKLEDAKTQVVVFTMEGTAEGASPSPIKHRSVFDVGRGVFRSADFEQVKFGVHFYLRLPEKSPQKS